MADRLDRFRPGVVSRSWLAPVRLLLAALTVGAIVTQLAIDSGRPDFSAVVLVPATMVLLGDANWWLPRWLDRILPRMDLEGTDGIDAEGAREDVGALVGS